MGGNVFKCCLPWCGSAEPKVDQPTISPPTEVRESPPRKHQPQVSPHLQDILEEDQEQQAEVDVCIVSTYNKYYYGKKRGRNVLVQSPSPTWVSGRKTKIRTRSVASSTTSEQPSAPTIPKMQAEQGSIGELQKYHNRYLRNRRHTLANVR